VKVDLTLAKNDLSTEFQPYSQLDCFRTCKTGHLKTRRFLNAGSIHHQSQKVLMSPRVEDCEAITTRCQLHIFTIRMIGNEMKRNSAQREKQCTYAGSRRALVM